MVDYNNNNCLNLYSIITLPLILPSYFCRRIFFYSHPLGAVVGNTHFAASTKYKKLNLSSSSFFSVVGEKEKRKEERLKRECVIVSTKHPHSNWTDLRTSLFIFSFFFYFYTFLCRCKIHIIILHASPNWCCQQQILCLSTKSAISTKRKRQIERMYLGWSPIHCPNGGLGSLN